MTLYTAILFSSIAIAYLVIKHKEKMKEQENEYLRKLYLDWLEDYNHKLFREFCNEFNIEYNKKNYIKFTEKFLSSDYFNKYVKPKNHND